MRDSCVRRGETYFMVSRISSSECEASLVRALEIDDAMIEVEDFVDGDLNADLVVLRVRLRMLVP